MSSDCHTCHERETGVSYPDSSLTLPPPHARLTTSDARDTIAAGCGSLTLRVPPRTDGRPVLTPPLDFGRRVVIGDGRGRTCLAVGATGAVNEVDLRSWG